MGLDTRMMIEGFIDPTTALEVIKTAIDETAVSCVKTYSYGDIKDIDFDVIPFTETGKVEEAYGFIDITYNGKRRNIFYWHSNIKDIDSIKTNLEYKLKGNAALAKAFVSDTTHFSLGYDEDAIEIMKTLAKAFGGGWIDENDCDNETFYFVK